MCGTSNERLPLLTGEKNHSRAVTLTMENEPLWKNTSLVALQRLYSVALDHFMLSFSDLGDISQKNMYVSMQDMSNS